MAPLDLQKCSASELSSYLLEHRFKQDAFQTTAFLLEATTTLPDADGIAAKIQQQAQSPKKEETKTTAALVSSQSDESQASASSLGNAFHSQPIELSLSNPRGKFHVTLHEHGLRATTIKNPQSIIIPAGSVQCALVFPKPSDCQRAVKKADAPAPSPMMLLCFDDETNDNDDDNKQQHPNVTFKGKRLSQICFTVPVSLGALEEESAASTVSVWIQRVCRSIKINPKTKVYRIRNPANDDTTTSTVWDFKSHQEAGKSTTSDGMPFVKCYHGVHDGVLFPMKEGLLFFKPPLFLSRNNLHSISCGRGQGASSRYVDMKIQTNDETSWEFTNISRDELGVLNHYIHKVLIPAMQQDAEDDSHHEESEAVVANEAVDDDAVVDVLLANDSDDSDEIEVVHVEAGRRTRRQAAFEATQQTKQHYMQNNVANDSDDEEDDDDDQFLPSLEEDNDEEGDEEVDYEPEGGGGDDDDESDEEESDKDVEVVVEVDDETEEDEEDEEASPPPKKKRRGQK